MSQVVAEKDGIRFYRIKEASMEDPIVDWYAVEDELEPYVVIILRSGTKLVASIPKPILRELGIVSAAPAAHSPGVPTVGITKNDVHSNLTDRKDIVELVVSWAEDYLRRQREREQAATSARRQR